MNQEAEGVLRLKMKYSVLTMADSLGIGEIESRGEEELISEIRQKEPASHQLLDAFLNTTSAWIDYSKEVGENKLTESPEVAAKLNQLSRASEQAGEKLLALINDA